MIEYASQRAFWKLINNKPLMNSKVKKNRILF